MGLLASIALTFVVLTSAMLLVSTLGRRRTGRRASLPVAERERLALTIGSDLADLASQTRGLRAQLEAVAANGRDMLEVEEAMGQSSRRPLWRQLEDANYEHDLERVTEAMRAWLARVEGLTGADRQIVDEAGVELEPVRQMVATDWRAVGPDRPSGLEVIIASFRRGLETLADFESALESYRATGYR